MISAALEGVEFIVANTDSQALSQSLADRRVVTLCILEGYSEREAAELVAGRLNGARVTVTARAGEGGKLFGSVTASDVATALSVIALTEIDRRTVTIAEAIKELGEFEVSVRLHEGVIAKATVEVVSE